MLAWELSNSLDSEFCIRAWTGALGAGRQPLINNSDQGCQFTSEVWLEAVESVGVDVSMDGRGRWIDNRFIERPWRSALKQEDIYVQDYADGLTAQRGLARWFLGTTTTAARPHQALGYATPGEWYEAPESYGASPWRWRRRPRCPRRSALRSPLRPWRVCGAHSGLDAEASESCNGENAEW